MVREGDIGSRLLELQPRVAVPRACNAVLSAARTLSAHTSVWQQYASADRPHSLPFILHVNKGKTSPPLPPRIANLTP